MFSSPLLLTIQEKNWQHFTLTLGYFSGLSEGGFTTFGISSWFSFSSGGAFLGGKMTAIIMITPTKRLKNK